MTKEIYGTLPDGRAVESYLLDNGCLRAQFLTFGAALDKLWAPDRDGNAEDILVGHPSLEDRVANNHCQGEICGRVCNRISGAKFTLNGKEYRLTANQEGPACLHGAAEFNTALWAAQAVDDHTLEMRYTSPAGAHGFPGQLQTLVRYTLDGNALRIEYEAASDADTVVNLTNHAYFNLAGGGQIFGHMLRIDAPDYLPLDANFVPTGEVRPVEGTVFDFRQAKPIGQCYDVNFCYPGAVEAWDPGTGRRMRVETDQCAVQLYTGQCLAEPCTGFCLETQHWPDAPNQPAFPSIALRAGEVFKSWTKYVFTIDNGQ